MATYTLDWSETNLGGSAVVSYARGALLDHSDKPAGATASLSCTRGLSSGANNLVVITVVTTGSSVLTFDYKTSTEAGWDKLHVDVDGVSQAEYSGIIAWTSHAGISIPSAGTHTIRFRYQKDPGGVNADRVWIAKLNITNTTTVNDDASTVDTYNLEDGAVPAFVTTSSWVNSTSEPITGTRSLRSPTSPANSGSYDMTVAKAAGTGYRAVGFDWKVSSENGWDKLFIYPDSTAGTVPTHPTAPAEGSPGWLEYSGTASGRFALILPAAASSFLLRYAKDGGGAAGSDAAWVDNMTMPAAAGGGPAEGTGSGALTFAGSGSGKRAPQGTATGSLALAGTGTGKRVAKGSGAGTTAFTGAGAGKRAPKGSGSGTVTLTGTGSGSTVRRGTGTGVLATVGTGTGKRTPKANGTSSLTFTGTAVGSAPSVDGAEGSGSGTLAWTGSGTGRRTPKGSGSGTVAYLGTGAGNAPSVDAATGSGAGVTAWTGTATGRRQPRGSGAGHLEVVGVAAGSTLRRGTGSGVLAFTGTATSLLPPKLSVGAPLPARHKAGPPLPRRHTAGAAQAPRYRTGGTP